MAQQVIQNGHENPGTYVFALELQYTFLPSALSLHSLLYTQSWSQFPKFTGKQSIKVILLFSAYLLRIFFKQLINFPERSVGVSFNFMPHHKEGPNISFNGKWEK